ncbi:putative baseplate assembly protein [Paenibacillus sp. y28]
MKQGGDGMLPLPNLDDRLFEQMVQDARKAIPAIFPSWTDENAHDPGITMMEMLAWLVEMQQYYLDRITEKHERKYLKLLGIRQRDAAQSRVGVRFHGVQRQMVLPRGTRLLAGNLPFELEERQVLVAANVDKVLVRAGAEAYDMTPSNEGAGVSFYAFGTQAAQGSRLYLGFDQPLPADTPISLHVQLFDKYPIPLVVDAASAFVPSGRVSWTYFGGETETGGLWNRLPLIQDGTKDFSHSGSVSFVLPSLMQPTVIHPAHDKSRYWLCCTLDEAGYELPPRVETVLLSTATAIQQETLSAVYEFDCGEAANFSVELSDALSCFGLVRVQVRQPDGSWIDWEETDALSACPAEACCYEVERLPREGLVRIRFGDGQQGHAVPEGFRCVRVISYRPEFEDIRWLGASNGLPYQTFRLEKPHLLPARLMLQVGEWIPGKGMVWEDWTRVDDFDSSKPNDRHYMLDAATGEIRFSDNEHGQVPDIPAEGMQNICIISCALGGGDQGNIKPHRIDRFEDPAFAMDGITPDNPYEAAGGRNAETLEDAKHRARLEQQHPLTAVTADDVERLALSTPNVRVARAKAIPLFKPGMRQDSGEQAPGHLTVVAVPYSPSSKPVPSPGFMETVRRHLNRYRLLTTEVHVMPPEYIKITVHAVVVVEPYLKEDASQLIQSLKRLLQPFDYTDGTDGWLFGRTVYKADVYEAIHRISGISYIQDLWLSAEGKGFRKDSDGDIVIPPYGLVFSGEHEIELISRTDV